MGWPYNNYWHIKLRHSKDIGVTIRKARNDIIMKPFPAHVDLDLAKFVPANSDRETRHGLPSEVLFCKNCAISNQRPNSTVEFQNQRGAKKETILFDQEGVCAACRAAEQKNATIDWATRRQELEELCAKYRRSDGRYDCVVPGSGGKDSFFAALVLKYEFGMHPLTVTWAPNIYTDWGWQNFQAWIHAGFDNQLFTPNGRVHRLLTRLALENLLHPFQPFILGQKNIAPRVAALHDIPLVFYGENEAEYGNPIQDNDSAVRDSSYFVKGSDNELFISGQPVSELQEAYGLSPQDFNIYLPGDPNLLAERNVQVHYLGYYLKWHPQSAYYYSVEHGGFRASPERTAGTFSKYNSIDDKMDDFHFYTLFIKFGIGRATYDAAQEVRSGDLTREEAIALVRRYDGEFPARFAETLFEYLSLPATEFPSAQDHFEQPVMDQSYFDNLCDRFRSPHIWNYEGNRWTLRHAIYDE